MTSTRTASDPPRSRRRPRLALPALIGAAMALGAPLTGPADRAEAAELGFPYRTDFSTAAGGTLTGDAHVDDGWLRLTDDVLSQAGAWQMDDVFPSDLGLEIEFEYAMYGQDDEGADGFALSLADGASPAGVGRPGAALGYACHGPDADVQCIHPGVPGAFAGIGFDRYGNFSSTINGSGPGRLEDQVVVRGSGDGVDGYRYLRGVEAPLGVGTTARAGARTVRVTIQPDETGTLGITVRSTDGPRSAFRTLLDDVPLDGPDQAPLPATLRLGFSASTGQHSNVHELNALSVWLPTDLRVEQSVGTAVAGERVAWTVTSSNRGRNPSAPSELEVAVPDGVQDVTWRCAAGPGGTCGAAEGGADDGTVRTSVDLGRGGSTVHTIEGTLGPDATGQLDSVATIRPAPYLGDTDETDNVARTRAPVTQRAELGTAKSVALVDGAESLAPGDEVEYTVTARNGGPSTAREVGVRDDLPDELRFAGSPDGCAAVGQRVTCSSTDDLAPGAERSFRFRATLDPDYRGDGSDVVNVAVAISPTDPDDGDPSEEVVLPPVVAPGDEGDDDGAGDAGEANEVAPTPAPTPARARPAATGSLAFTGSQGVGIVAGVGLGVTALGLVVRLLLRRVLVAGRLDRALVVDGE